MSCCIRVEGCVATNCDNSNNTNHNMHEFQDIGCVYVSSWFRSDELTTQLPNKFQVVLCNIDFILITSQYVDLLIA